MSSIGGPVLLNMALLYNNCFVKPKIRNRQDIVITKCLNINFNNQRPGPTPK